MKSYIALALASTALAYPQSSDASGCPSSVSGTFQIQTVNQTTNAKRSLEERQLSGALTLTLENGVLKDQAGRTGYIAANDQFQFDAPVQAGALQTKGFALCSNGSLALTAGSRPAGETTWFQCLSGDFYNLYADSQGAQCSKIYIQAVNKGSGSGASQISDGQPQVTSAAVSQISDGQIQATTAAASVPVVSQISDGQIQATSAGHVVSQISDGQVQATSAGHVVSQISDGQIQATSAGHVVSQISDGQIQATSAGHVVTQISDGQIQATPAPSVAGVVSQISDGQIQATSAGHVVSQISDGQPQAPVATGNATVLRPNATTTQPAEYTGAAASSAIGAGALAAGLLGLFAML